MKIIAICGSPRGNKSQTKALAEKVLEAAKGRGAEVELVDLSQARLEFCRACEDCHQKPGCVRADDVTPLLDKMLAADGIVLATPVYLNQVTAQLKTVLDRTSHFVHCLRLMGKYMAAVTTSGSGRGADVQAYLQQYGISVGAQCVGGVDASVPLKPADLEAAAALGDTLVAAIRDKKRYPGQEKAIEARKSHFGKLVTLRKDHWVHEYQYWKDHGWL